VCTKAATRKFEPNVRKIFPPQVSNQEKSSHIYTATWLWLFPGVVKLTSKNGHHDFHYYGSQKSLRPVVSKHEFHKW
ncbi:mCG1032438, partial [Mus musculus]